MDKHVTGILATTFTSLKTLSGNWNSRKMGSGMETENGNGKMLFAWSVISHMSATDSGTSISAHLIHAPIV